MRVSVVIPTLNEAASIGRVLADLPGDRVTEVIVVDGGSTDGTCEEAARRGARVVSEPRRGYGRACLTGLAHVREPDVVVFLDGDYSDRPSELPRLLEPIAEGRADVVIGSRIAGGLAPGAMAWHQEFGNRLAAALVRALYRVPITDLGPFRSARYDLLLSLGLEEQSYGWPVEMIVKARLSGYRVLEVPVSYHPRIGRSKISGTIRGTVGAGAMILGGIFKYRWRALDRPGAADVRRRGPREAPGSLPGEEP
jgi:glycosyltransferase involved in cell wall biosynthesis